MPDDRPSESRDPEAMLREAFFGSVRERDQQLREYAAVMQSPVFVAETQRLERVVRDYAYTLRLCFLTATRDQSLSENSFFLRGMSDLVQSGLMAGFAIHEGF